MRKKLTITLLAGLSFTLFAGCQQEEADSSLGAVAANQPPGDPEARAEVDTLMASMRDGSWQGRFFPEVDWRHVDALLDRAESNTPLLRFPINVYSSQSQNSCSEGIMVLWLVEGIRRGAPGGYPSLNPLCLCDDAGADVPWEEASEANRAAAARAYREWWKNAKSEDAAARGEQDPLADTGLSWY